MNKLSYKRKARLIEKLGRRDAGLRKRIISVIERAAKKASLRRGEGTLGVRSRMPQLQAPLRAAHRTPPLDQPTLLAKIIR